MPQIKQVSPSPNFKIFFLLKKKKIESGRKHSIKSIKWLNQFLLNAGICLSLDDIVAK